MASQQNNAEPSKLKIATLIPCFVLFAIFFINVLIGKANISYGLNLPHLGNLPEFLLLCAATTLLIVAALKAEAEEKKSN